MTISSNAPSDQEAMQEWQARSPLRVRSSRAGLAEGAVLALFGTLLALLTRKHEMYLDEAQAWLIARDSQGLSGLFHQLHYESHPAVWYLLLYLPAHVSWNIVWMQSLNFALALVFAWLVMYERRLPIVIRILLIFSPAVFSTMGLLARSYMLAGVLLIAAARCLLARRPHQPLAIVLLALAINTHFLAIPVAAGIFIWLYWLVPFSSWTAAVRRFREREFIASVAFLGFSLVICYFTIRPAADIYLPQYHVANASPFESVMLGIGRIWRYFVPSDPQNALQAASSTMAERFLPEFADAFVTIGIWLLAISVLPGRRSRYFMISVSVLWMLAVSATVHIPLPQHATFLTVCYAIALMMKDPGDQSSWLPSHAVQPVLLVLLTVQLPLTALSCIEQWRQPFSGPKATAAWLQSTGLSRRPLVIQPKFLAPAILAYTELRSAYFPNCECYGSFLTYSSGWSDYRPVKLDELRRLSRETGVSPVVLSGWELPPSEVQQLNLRLRFTSPHGYAWNVENFFVYEFGEGSTNQNVGKSK
jgi:hypothetical protein